MNRRHYLIILLLAATLMSAYAQKTSRTKVIAHRGAWKNTNLPQNSLAALNAAVAMGCFASECDIWMTADSVLVVNHDPDFFNMPIESTPYAELLKTKYPNGESIATLDQFLHVITKQNGTRLVLDVKPSKVSKSRTLAIARKSHEQVQAANASRMVDYIFFDYDASLVLEKLDPDANIAYLLGDRSPGQVEQDGLWGIDYHYKLFEKNSTWIKDAHNRNLTVNAWTVNDRGVAQSLIDQQIDYITTDEPEMLLEMVVTRRP